MTVTLVIQHAMLLRRVILSSVICVILKYVSTLSMLLRRVIFVICDLPDSKIRFHIIHAPALGYFCHL